MFSFSEIFMVRFKLLKFAFQASCKVEGWLDPTCDFMRFICSNWSSWVWSLREGSEQLKAKLSPLWVKLASGDPSSRAPWFLHPVAPSAARRMLQGEGCITSSPPSRPHSSMKGLEMQMRQVSVCGSCKLAEVRGREGDHAMHTQWDLFYIYLIKLQQRSILFILQSYWTWGLEFWDLMSFILRSLPRSRTAAEPRCLFNSLLQLLTPALLTSLIGILETTTHFFHPFSLLASMGAAEQVIWGFIRLL